MLKYDEYIHCFTFLDYFTQSFYLTLYHFIEVIFLSFFRNARSLFCSSSSSWEKKDWGKYSFQTWPLVCNFICISWCAIITNYWHILMEWVSLAEIFALYHWKKNYIQGYKGFFYHGKFERWKINLTTTVKDSTEFMSYNDFINTKICDLVLLNIEIKVCEKRFAIYIHAIQYSGKKNQSQIYRDKNCWEVSPSIP